MLVNNVRSQDRILFYCASSLLPDWNIPHFSTPVAGRGRQAKHDCGEQDGLDEAILPLDFEEADCITDKVGQPISPLGGLKLTHICARLCEKSWFIVCRLIVISNLY